MKNIFILLLLPFMAISQTYTTGSYGVLEINNSTIIINGNVTFNNVNTNGPGTVTIPVGSKLTVNSSFNLNGHVTINNNGTIIIKGNNDIQNGYNKIFNTGYIEANVGQIVDQTSYIENCGTIKFKGVFSSHGKEGSIKQCDCSVFEVEGLDITTFKAFKGSKGIIRIIGNTFNLNNYFGEGLLYYSGHINLIKYLEGVNRVGSGYECSLPIIFSSVKFNREYVEFSIENVKNTEWIIIQKSDDGVTWRDFIITKDLKEGKNKIPLK